MPVRFRSSIAWVMGVVVVAGIVLAVIKPLSQFERLQFALRVVNLLLFLLLIGLVGLLVRGLAKRGS